MPTTGIPQNVYDNLQKEKDELRKENDTLISNLRSEKIRFNEHFNFLSSLLMKKIPSRDEEENTKSTIDLIEILAPPLIYFDTKDFHEGNNRVHIYQEHKDKDAKIAIKMFVNEKEELAKIEFQNMLRCCLSPYVIKPYQMAYNDDKIAISMEYGGIAMNRFWDYWTLTLDSIYDKFLDLVKGLKSIHDLMIYHGDIKPQNILMHGDKLRYADFGAAVKFKSAATLMRTRRLKPYLKEFTLTYLAPEAAYPLAKAIEFDEHSNFDMLDIYSLTLTMHSLITKHLLIANDTKHKNVNNELAYNAFITWIKAQLERTFLSTGILATRGLVNLIVSGLSFDAKKRPTLDQMITKLEKLKDEI